MKEIEPHQILEFFASEEDHLNLGNVYPHYVITMLEELGATVNTTEWDTNGWQYDYWQPFTYRNNRYVFAGSGYYGNPTISRLVELDRSQV